MVRTILQKLKDLFKVDEWGDPWDRDERDSPEAWVESALVHGNKRIEEAWAPIRALALKGNAAGAVASLALFGAIIGSSTASPPPPQLFWTIVLFATGLASSFFRQAVLVQKERVNRDGGAAGAINEECGYSAPPIFDVTARILDLVCPVFLVTGMVLGFSFLYLVSHP